MRLNISVLAGFIAIAAALPQNGGAYTVTETIVLSRCVVWGPLPPQVTYTTSFTYVPPATVTTMFTNNPIQRITVTSCPMNLKRSDAPIVTSTLYTNYPTQTVTEKHPSITTPPMEVVSVHPVQTESAVLAPMPTIAETHPFTFTITKRHATVVNETQSLLASTFIANNETKTVFPHFTATANATTYINTILTLSANLPTPFSLYTNTIPTETPGLATRLVGRELLDQKVTWANSDCLPCLDWTECSRCSGACSNCVNLFCRDPFGGYPMCVSLERLTGIDRHLYNRTFHDFIGYSDDY
ncbi:hypothetical protein PTNB73_02653 [Pyrenophora teres f. teres]|uniref:Uncharacterized protein n=1 Tax=Pyrenophora teres f. teres TaxID=97479 RepID=A0A6S6W290_9PLEO|nr:hypothetical protein PTNB29_02703 [Pyrenophora teres f. teres]KAE8871194.1 hypothetical protein PTNB73_02653 [Pyrenophora teres f. teres]CAE7174375.1 hypothetical protein PTTW11_05621 [Pyrenophora teres f. teres]